MPHNADAMACSDWLQQLDRFVDGELSSDDARAFDAHMRGCPSCASQALDRMQLKRMVRSVGHTFTSRAEFRESMRKAIAPKSPKSQTRSSFWRWQWAVPVFAVLVIATLLSSYLGMRQARREQTYRELADLHVANLASSTPVDVVSTDRHTVKPWFQGRIPFAFNLPELQNSDFTLLGGRVTYMEQTPGAQLVYTLRNHRISVFIFQADRLPASLPGSLTATKNASFSMQTWSKEGLRFFVVGDVSADDIRKLSVLFQSAAGS
jgi:anti-sigma factor RsiW